MAGRLLFLFVLIPLIELALLVQLGQVVGLWPTIALVALTGVLGATLARAEGLRTLARFQSEVAAGRMPGGTLLDGLCILVGGAFLLTPGLLTDLAGFSLLVPFSRRWIQRRIRAGLERRIESGELKVFVAGSGPGFPFGGMPERPQDGEADLDPRHEIDGAPRD